MVKRASITDAPPAGSFIPDLCQPRAVLAVVVGAQLLAVLLVLAQPVHADRWWPRLGMWSLGAQWVGLLGTAGLCAARQVLGRLSAGRAGAIALVWLLLLSTATTLVAEGFHWWPAEPSELGRLLARNLLLTGLVGGAVLRILYLAHVARSRERAHHQARLDLLQARMRPHFLFNSLNTIASLAASDPQRAEDVTLALADLLRASLGAGDRLIPLADELDLCRRYLAMEQLRLGDRLVIEWQVDALPAQARVPPLTVQPLLENAVFHGIEPAPHGGRIGLALRVSQPGVLDIEIDNPLAAGRAGTGLHMALANLRARLAGHFGAAASLTQQITADRHTVRLRLPFGTAPA
ncbi:MAG: sensor histidine kinase [Pseudomonadota bacterium]